MQFRVPNLASAHCVRKKRVGGDGQTARRRPEGTPLRLRARFIVPLKSKTCCTTRYNDLRRRRLCLANGSKIGGDQVGRGYQGMRLPFGEAVRSRALNRISSRERTCLKKQVREERVGPMWDVN